MYQLEPEDDNSVLVCGGEVLIRSCLNSMDDS